ncbi:MAG: PAS domain S-box protein [Desulfatiglans sp.]|jgi:PAS domain S-box-containing protein|nr:PAS domain S-box protein [Desulfatiglans sp.]
MNLRQLFQAFLNGGTVITDSDSLRKTRALNLFEIGFVIATIFLGLFYYSIHAFLLFHACLAASFLGVTAIILLRITKKPELIGNYAVFILWALLIIIRWNNGGVSATGLTLLSWIWNGVLILLAIFLAGYMWGTIWACLVFIESGIAIFLLNRGYLFNNLIPLEITAVYSLGFYLVGLAAILFFAFMFESDREEALEREQMKVKMLRESKRYLEEILKRSPIPTFVLDNKHRVVQWNRGCEEISGIRSKDILGRPVWEGFLSDRKASLADRILDYPNSLPTGHEEFIASSTDTGCFTVETRLPYQKEGVEAIINTAPIVDGSGRIIGAIQTIQDVSKNEKPHRDDRASGVSPAFNIDSRGKISSWNRACETHFGYASSQMVGKSPLVLVSKAYREKFRKTIFRVFKGESIKGREWQYDTGTGGYVDIVADVEPIQDSSGKIQACMVISTDITDLKMRQRKVEAYAAECKKRLRNMTDEYHLLKKNIASFIRKEDHPE